MPKRGTSNMPPSTDSRPIRLKRVSVASMDKILGKPFRVLDRGFVRVVDYMGGDASIVQAARVSYGQGTKRIQNDRGLIRYLMRHSHTTPFEMCEIKLHVRTPMDTWRQWIRHRTASINEYSTRYSLAIDDAQRTKSDEWRLQAAVNRQGSKGTLPKTIGARLSRAESRLQNDAREAYDARIAVGVAREQARKDLPLSTYTEAYWKTDLHNLFHFLELRMDPHAQAEIRAFATTIGSEIVSRWTPISWEAFLDYRRNSLHITRIEREIIAALTSKSLSQATAIARKNGLLEDTENGELKPSRERAELDAKLRILGLVPPWGST
jgi:thymidylate synthase (FAD)